MLKCLEDLLITLSYINAKDEKGNEEREGAKKGVLVNPEGSAKIVPAATKANDADLSA